MPSAAARRAASAVPPRIAATSAYGQAGEVVVRHRLTLLVGQRRRVRQPGRVRVGVIVPVGALGDRVGRDRPDGSGRGRRRSPCDGRSSRARPRCWRRRAATDTPSSPTGRSRTTRRRHPRLPRPRGTLAARSLRGSRRRPRTAPCSTCGRRYDVTWFETEGHVCTTTVEGVSVRCPLTIPGRRLAATGSASAGGGIPSLQRRARRPIRRSRRSATA